MIDSDVVHGALAVLLGLVGYFARDQVKQMRKDIEGAVKGVARIASDVSDVKADVSSLKTAVDFLRGEP